MPENGTRAGFIGTPPTGRHHDGGVSLLPPPSSHESDEASGFGYAARVAEDFYTVDEAARILKLTPGRIRQMLRAGDLAGVSPEDSGGRGWKIPMHAVHDRDRPARVDRPPEAPGAPERLTDPEVEVRELRYQLGLSRGRVELTEKAESTLREERDRLLAERDRERERAERLQAELDRARLPWWRKVFGG